MKSLIFITLLLCLAGKSTAQNQSIYYDALFIKEKCFDGQVLFNRTDLDSVLKIYYPKNVNIIASLKENPFFKKYVPDALGHGVGTTSFTGNPISSLAGLDVTKFANAIADLMIDRAKQELTIAFFNRFQKFADKNPEFEILFPKTTDNLSNLLTQSYPQMLPALRNSFFEDLKLLTYHLDDVMELPKYRKLLANFPEVRIAIRSIRLVHDLETGKSNAADVIRDFAALEEWKEDGSTTFKNMGTAIKFAALFSEGLRSRNNSSIWVSSKEIGTLVTDDAFTAIFMGLVYQKVKLDTLSFYTKNNIRQPLDSILSVESANIILFQNKIGEFINLTEKVQKTYNELEPKIRTNAKISNEDIYNYINVSIEVTDYAFSIVKIFNEELVTENYLTIVKKSNGLYKDIYSSQYTQAVNDAVDILTEVHRLTEANNTPSSGITAKDKKDQLGALLSFTQKVKPYALFMANMVEAKDEKQIKTALDNVILPVGSSSIKKYSGGNISVQTYLGAFYSVSNNRNTNSGTWSDKFGVTAPIGISWTPGAFSWGKGGALSLFGALFDLGAIVDYKLKKEPDATSSDPNATVISKDYKVELGQIFSPGAYAVYALGADLPLSVGFGAQYGPGLSKIDAGNNTVLTNPSWRCNFFLAVDLTFFTLYNRHK